MMRNGAFCCYERGCVGELITYYCDDGGLMVFLTCLIIVGGNYWEDVYGATAKNLKVLLVSRCKKIERGAINLVSKMQGLQYF